MTAPRRRRFRFSLRTLLVVVTLSGVGIGYVVNERARIQERRAAIQSLVDAPEDPLDDESNFDRTPCEITIQGVSWFRCALGDMRVLRLLLPRTADRRTEQYFIGLFPEAQIQRRAPFVNSRRKLWDESAEANIDDQQGELTDDYGDNELPENTPGSQVDQPEQTSP